MMWFVWDAAPKIFNAALGISIVGYIVDVVMYRSNLIFNSVIGKMVTELRLHVQALEEREVEHQLNRMDHGELAEVLKNALNNNDGEEPLSRHGGGEED